MCTSFQSVVPQVSQKQLEELRLQRNLINYHFNPVLRHVDQPSVDPMNGLQLLYQAVKNIPIKNIIDKSFIDDFNEILKKAREKLKEEIKLCMKKCEYSYLYGSLVREWLELEEADKIEKRKERIKREKYEAVRKKKSLIFTPPSINEFEARKFRKYLSYELLSFEENTEGRSIMNETRKASRDFFKIDNQCISTYDVQCCIKVMIAEERLPREKIATLKELNANSDALTEVASLLTNRLLNLKSWTWPSELVELRRKAYLNEDITTALFLQYVGTQWAAHFKGQFMKIYKSKIFAKVFCNNDSIERAIESKKKELHESTFLSCLPDSLESHDQQQSAKNSSATDTDVSLMSFFRKAVCKLTGKAVCLGAYCTHKSPEPFVEFKQAFLHTLSSEVRLHKVIRQDEPLVVVQADLESFDSYVIHDAALIALEYFGVPDIWLEFFKKFLQPQVAPVEDEKPQLVVRGVPTGHTLSLLIKEMLLFLLDLLVSQRCNGMRIYRISDQFWFWGDVMDYVSKTWETMNTYGRMIGLKINENRSGSVMIYSNQALTKVLATNSILCGPFPLPRKSIRWGYLELYSDGTFRINQKAVKIFLDEMRVMLGKSQCVLEWINVFNDYMERFVRNFGKEHLEQISSALRIIYAGLFGSENGNPVEKLKSEFERFREADILDAWVYLPLEKGGLGLVNPFIEIMSSHEEYYYINDDDYFVKLHLKDKDLWEIIVEENVRRYGKIKDPRSFDAEYFHIATVETTVPT